MRANQLEQSTSNTQQTERQNGPDRQRVREHNSAQTITVRYGSLLRPVESPHPQSTQTRLATGSKSPAYLRRKNPYGTVLDRIEHPYRDARAAITGPPSQSGAGPDGRLRTTGAFCFRTRIPTMQLELAINESESPPQQLLPEKTAQLSAVQAAKSLFEGNGTRSRLLSLATPSEEAFEVEAAPLDSLVLPQTRPSSFYSEPAQRYNLQRKNNLETDAHGPETGPMSRLPSSARTRILQRNQLFIRPKASSPRADSAASKLDERGTPKDDPLPSRTTISPASSTQLAHTVHPTSDDCASIAQAAKAVPKLHDQQQASGKTVRSRGEHTNLSATESEEDIETGQRHWWQPESKYPSPHRLVRGDVKKVGQLKPIRSVSSSTRISSCIKSSPTNFSPDRVMAEVRSISPRTPPEQSDREGRQKIHTVLNTCESDKARAESVLSDQTQDVAITLFQQESARDNIVIANIGVQLGYDEMQVPDHIDWRAAFGRRKTQDFGFPGARIKPHKGKWNQRPLQAYSSQGKGSDRQSLYRRTNASSNDGIAHNHLRSSTGHMLLEPLIYEKQRAWKEAAKKRSTPSTIGSSTGTRSKHQRSGHIALDECGDRLANTLGYMIDDLLQEHSSSLQDVVQNIEEGQRNLPRLRRTPDKIEMHTGPVYTTYQPPRTYEELCFSQRPRGRRDTQLQDPLVLWLREHKWQSPFSRCQPLQAERLNVGATGQLRPNVNDSYHVLRRSLRTVEDLVDLIESAADNFGVDLESRPTGSDEQSYLDAPFEED